MATNEKPEVEVPADQPPSYQLEIEDIVEGDGDEAVVGKVVEVHYVGVSWKNGKQFDASWDRGDTFKFGLGKGQVIKGWDDGVAGMRVGGRRRIEVVERSDVSAHVSSVRRPGRRRRRASRQGR